MNKTDAIAQKLAILRKGTIPVKKSKPKTRDDRKQFWSTVMENGENDSVKLKASELLGRAEADFVENDNPLGQGLLIPVLPMDLKGLHEAFARTANRVEGQPRLRIAGGKSTAES